MEPAANRRNSLGTFVYTSIAILHLAYVLVWISSTVSVLLGLVNPHTIGFHSLGFVVSITTLLLVHSTTSFLCWRICDVDATSQATNYVAAAALLASGLVLTLSNAHYLALNILAAFFAVPLIFPMSSNTLCLLRPVNKSYCDMRTVEPIEEQRPLYNYVW